MIFLATIMGAAVFCGVPPGMPQSGYYYQGSQQIVLPAWACPTIKHAPKDNGLGSMAVFILAHEEGHAHDPADGTYAAGECSRPSPCEHYADCWAVRHMISVAQLLGWPLRTARRFYAEAKAARWGYHYQGKWGCWHG